MSATAKKFSRGVASKRYVRASVKDKFAREYEGLDEEPTTVEIEASHAKVFDPSGHKSLHGFANKVKEN